MQKHPFVHFLESFIPQVESKSKQLNKALWLLETTGSGDAADLKTELDTELRMLFNDAEVYNNLLAWDGDASLTDPLLKRQLNILIRSFKQNRIDPALLKEIAEKESELLLSYANFRPQLDGKALTENEIRAILKNETSSEKRKKAWQASKDIGDFLAPQILNLVALRNKAAHSLGYSDYFTMQLELQEVDPSWLMKILNDLAVNSDEAYSRLVDEVEQRQCRRFGVSSHALGPWAWSEPFCQEDPLDSAELDELVRGVDLLDISVKFYERMGIDVLPILKRSDMDERPGKNQHAFCINIDREEDIRTLNNVKETLKWLETLLHEFGHAIYEMGFDSSLPWLLREPPHMITTEAMALIAGRQAYRHSSLGRLVRGKDNVLMQKGEASLKRRQLIFSRWVLVMTHFERALYADPSQDLNSLWWQLVAKYQKVRVPADRQGKNDWAAKYHIGLAPVYYFSYLLGEMFASSIEETLLQKTGSRDIDTSEAGLFLQQKLFLPGNSMDWSALVEHVSGHPLTADPWIAQFATAEKK